MAKDIKTIDVDNSSEEFYIKIFQSFGWELKSSQRVYNQDSKPMGAFTYSGATYIHSETSVVDFTKLVFERDRNLENYDEIVDLEGEFWILSENVSDGKPYMPPNIKTMKQWAEYFQPDIRTEKQKTSIHVKFFISTLLSFIVGNIVFGVLLNYDGGSMGALLALFMICAWIGTYKYGKHYALKKALRDKNSKYRETLENIYNSIIEQIEAYDSSTERMGEIICQARRLI